MRVVRGRDVVEMDPGAFAELVAAHARVVVDMGTGDGRFPYRMAQEHPSTLYVGCDAVPDNMGEVASRSARKPAKGGAPNLVLVVASVEDSPPELIGVADEVHAILPWGRLMEGIVTGDPAVLGGLRGLAKPGARVHIVLNVGVWDVSTPRHVEPLPEVTDQHVEDVLVSAFAAARMSVRAHGPMSPDEVRALRSTWAGRLTHGGGGRFSVIEAVAT